MLDGDLIQAGPDRVLVHCGSLMGQESKLDQVWDVPLLDGHVRFDNGSYVLLAKTVSGEQLVGTFFGYGPT